MGRAWKRAEPVRSAVAAVLVFAVVAALVAAASGAGSVGSTVAGSVGERVGSAGCVPAWRIVPSVHVQDRILFGVAVVSADDVWAVGGTPWWEEEKPLSLIPRPLIEHWDGTRWRVVSSPRVRGRLNGVAVVSANDVWAVGISKTSSDERSGRPLIEHWDGQRWAKVPIRIVYGTDPAGGLNGVAATAKNDVWAVGDGINLHWDGHRFSDSEGPFGDELNAVAAIAKNDVWAVGPDSKALHWNGVHWRKFALPRSGGADAPDPFDYYDVAASSTNDVWAVGGEQSMPGAAVSSLVHWDGKRWRVNKDPTGWVLHAVAVVSSSEIWIANQPTYPQNSAVARRKNSAWQTTPLPGRPEIRALAVASNRRDIWAVGALESGQNELDPLHATPIVERYGC